MNLEEIKAKASRIEDVCNCRDDCKIKGRTYIVVNEGTEDGYVVYDIPIEMLELSDVLKLPSKYENVHIVSLSKEIMVELLQWIYFETFRDDYKSRKDDEWVTLSTKFSRTKSLEELFNLLIGSDYLQLSLTASLITEIVNRFEQKRYDDIEPSDFNTLPEHLASEIIMKFDPVMYDEYFTRVPCMKGSEPFWAQGTPWFLKYTTNWCSEEKLSKLKKLDYTSYVKRLLFFVCDDRIVQEYESFPIKARVFLLEFICLHHWVNLLRNIMTSLTRMNDLWILLYLAVQCASQSVIDMVTICLKIRDVNDFDPEFNPVFLAIQKQNPSAAIFILSSCLDPTKEIVASCTFRQYTEMNDPPIINEELLEELIKHCNFDTCLRSLYTLSRKNPELAFKVFEFTTCNKLTCTAIIRGLIDGIHYSSIFEFVNNQMISSSLKTELLLYVNRYAIIKKEEVLQSMLEDSYSRINNPGRCEYIFSRGPQKGERCDDSILTDYKYCASHKRRGCT